MEDQKESVRKQQAEVTKLNAVIRDMEKDIIVLKKEIQERDDTIQDKVWHFSTPDVHHFLPERDYVTFGSLLS